MRECASAGVVSLCVAAAVCPGALAYPRALHGTETLGTLWATLRRGRP